MGKLLKLVCSQKWSADHRGVEQTLRMLFRKFAKLTNSNSSLASSPMAVPSSQASVALVATDIGNSQDESMVPTEDPQVENSLVLAEPELEDARPKNEPSSDVIPPSPKQTSPTNHNMEDDIMVHYPAFVSWR
jgi:hypothetical protein